MRQPWYHISAYHLSTLDQRRGGLEIEEETFYDLQAFFKSSLDQITEVESREHDTEEQLNVRRSTRSREGGKQDIFDCFLCNDYDDLND